MNIKSNKTLKNEQTETFSFETFSTFQSINLNDVVVGLSVARWRLGRSTDSFSFHFSAAAFILFLKWRKTDRYGQRMAT